ncbi:MAG: outer membrane protein assembly factor BamA [Rickettsiales bacterium]|jgi:outer membrane protein insertion porin family|nr:outer membrane protein assembly factor BamA [Rickettsiales bacterium]
MKKFLLLFLLFAQMVQAEVIKTINVMGNERIDKTYIDSYLKLKQGEHYTIDKANNSIKSIYESGYFEKVDVDFKNGVLNIKVIENPMISEIFFDGNDELNDETLTNEITLKKKSLFNKNKLNNDVKRIINLYKGGGRFEAKVIPEMVKEDSNRIKLIFKINEGNATKIDEIKIIGAKQYSESDLLKEIRSREWHWYKFGMGSNYIPDLVEMDKEILRKFYFSKGYVDFEVLSANADVDIDNKWVYLTFLISEGQKYFFGEIDLVNNIEKVNDTELKKIIKALKKGKVFNNDKVQEIVDKLNMELAKTGYVFVEITPQMRTIDDKIDLTFVVKESPKIYIGEIKIIGNTRTHDEVIRKELRFGEGDPLNMTNYNRSIQMLYGTGFFDKVDIQKAQGQQPDVVDLIVSVNERKTGELSFGVGYSTLDGPNANVGITENNLLGMGHNLGINVLVAKDSKNISLSYGKPNFLGRDLYAGASIYYQIDNDNDAMNYDEARIGGSIYGVYNITDFLKQRLFYNVYRDKITSISSTYVGLVQEQDLIVSSVGQSLYYDTRDNRMDTSTGVYHTWTLEYSGIGGDKQYYKNTGNINFYFSIYPKYLTLKLSGFGGAIEGVGSQKLDSTDGFYLNENILRGFKYGGVGPRIGGSNGSAMAGKYYYVGLMELKFPILPKEYNVFGGLFYNGGTLTGTDLEKTKIYDSISNPMGVYDSNSIRTSYGLTIYWQTPMGMLNLIFSRPLQYEKFDKPENFFFNFGMGF